MYIEMYKMRIEVTSTFATYQHHSLLFTAFSYFLNLFKSLLLTTFHYFSYLSTSFLNFPLFFTTFAFFSQLAPALYNFIWLSQLSLTSTNSPFYSQPFPTFRKVVRILISVGIGTVFDRY